MRRLALAAVAAILVSGRSRRARDHPRQGSRAGADFQLTGFWNKENCDGRPFRAEKRWQVFPKR
jgi:hypothetical protein